MDNKAFNLGDTVFLKSGGPPMNVIGHSPNGRIWCEWSTAKGRIEEASFEPATLTKQCPPVGEI